MSRSGIPSITEWLHSLHMASRAIEHAGVEAGANQARAAGMPASADADTVTVQLRARKPLGSVPVAMAKGMGDEFDRKARQ